MDNKLITSYSAAMLKEMFKKAKSNIAKHEKARLRESTYTSGDVGTSYYWKTKADMEFYYNEKQAIYREMFELNCVSNWYYNLHQVRYNFVLKNDVILGEYRDFVSTNHLL